MTMVEQVKRMMMHSAYDTCSGVLVTSFHSHSPDLVPGDLAYLDPNRPHDVQLRPVLDGERPGGNYSGATWLVWTAHPVVRFAPLSRCRRHIAGTLPQT